MLSFCCHGAIPGRKSPAFSRLLAFRVLFKLDRCRGFAGAVVEHAVDVLDLVNDAAGDGLEQAPRNLGGFGRHEIGGGHGAQATA